MTDLQARLNAASAEDIEEAMLDFMLADVDKLGGKSMWSKVTSKGATALAIAVHRALAASETRDVEG